jgi:peptidoglycan hydrolase CwlO-like protein
VSEQIDNENTGQFHFRPATTTITLRDVVFIISIVITGTLAWASISSRISTQEENLKKMSEVISELKSEIRVLNASIEGLKESTREKLHEIDKRISLMEKTK